MLYESIQEVTFLTLNEHQKFSPGREELLFLANDDIGVQPQ
jgi:hypothetical protein